MKKKYYLYGFLILLIAFIAYNYYAAADAEGDITKIIQKQIDEPRPSLAIQYTAIDISPFQGNIRFEDLNIIQPKTAKKVKEITLDLSYWNFLIFNFGGVEYGLKHISNTHLILDEIVQKNRKTQAKISFNHLQMTYNGQLWDAFQAYFTPKPATKVHTLTVVAEQAAYQKPESLLGTFQIDSITVHHTFATKRAVESAPLNTVHLDNITWSMPKNLQQKYAFLIQGFGLKADSISFSQANMAYIITERQVKITEGSIDMKLFKTSFHGLIVKQPVASFSPLYITITDLSPKLMATLQNIKQLFKLPIPVNNQAFKFRLSGPIKNPEIILDKKRNLPHN